MRNRDSLLTNAMCLHRNLLLLIPVDAIDEVEVGVFGGHDEDLTVFVVVQGGDRGVGGNSRSDLNTTRVPLHRLHNSLRVITK